MAKNKKDMTEKALIAYNDVFADIVNNLLFNGRKVISENELEKGRERSAYLGEKGFGNRNGIFPNFGRRKTYGFLILELKTKANRIMICQSE